LTTKFIMHQFCITVQYKMIGSLRYINLLFIEMDFLGDGQKWTIYYFLNSVLFQVIVCINIYYFVLKQHLRKNSQTLGWSTNLNLCCVFIVLLRLYLNEEKIYISQWTNHLALVVICIDRTYSYKSNYHTITTMTAPERKLTHTHIHIYLYIKT
jgi:hypothetical protein